jgi:pSer/pThr/pTyr-binding forkhead associated (FHA) protein
MKAKLILTSKDGQTTQEVPFDRPSITIGRKPNNDLAFNRPEISGSHAAFLFENSQYFVMDLGSTNGTLLNGAQLVAREKYGLQDNDVITVAPFAIQFLLEDESMDTMIEVPSQPGASAQKKMRSGTAPDLGAAKIATGTEEHLKEERAKKSAAQAPPPPAPAPAPNPPKAEPAAAQPAPAPAPAAAQPAPAVPSPQPLQTPASGIDHPVIPAKSSSGITDYVWLGIGAILVLAAISLIIFILIGL